jgi:hypothetical protein
VIDVCMAAFSYSAVDRKEEGVNQSSPTRRPLPDLVPVERMDGDAGASAAIASKLAGGDVVTGAPQVSVEFGGINKDLFVSRGPGAPEEVFQDEINGGFRRESSGGSTDSEVCVPSCCLLLLALLPRPPLSCLPSVAPSSLLPSSTSQPANHL